MLINRAINNAENLLETFSQYVKENELQKYMQAKSDGKNIIYCRYMMNHKEICKILNISRKTLKSWLEKYKSIFEEYMYIKSSAYSITYKIKIDKSVKKDSYLDIEFLDNFLKKQVELSKAVKK